MDSDADESEDYVSYGTPLDPIDEDEIPRKRPLNVEEQVVLDKQGRRRFHGAFTGGFSAGFFNSVGSLEGWTPSTFKSTRSDRGQKYSQKPEDFMDEEDMEEFGIAPKVIRPTSDFREQQTNKRKRYVPSDGPIPGEPVLHLFLQPVRDTVGVRLLKKMGWKPGQGVGPRLTKQEKKKSAKEREKVQKKVYGCSLPDEFCGSSAPSHASESSDDEEKEKEVEVLYAPDDIQPFICVPKDDVFGIGYSGLDRRPILFAGKLGPPKKSILNMTENKKKISISGQAFGVGAFEDDDEDIYSTEDMSHYDFALEDVKEKKKDSKKSSRWDHPTGESCNYVGEPLEGFILAQTSPPIIFFPPPKLPPDFRPIHKVQKSRFEPSDDASSKGDGRKKGLGRHDLTASDREAIISGTRKTVSAEAIKIKVEPESDVEGSANSQQSTTAEKASSAASAGNSKEITHFKPFAADPDKQRRYDQYLGLLKSNQKERLAELQPLSMTEWERDREKMEFEQASRLYQPLSNLMSDRFVSALHPDVGDDGSPSVVSFMKEEVSEKVKAAKMKMYGKLTRETLSWNPCSLLYKRFNIPDPGISVEQEVKKRGTKFSVFDFMASQTHNSLTSATSELPTSSFKEHASEAAPSKSMEAVEKENIIFPDLPVEKHPENEEKFPDPPSKIDLFKAIFQSSSDSESEDEPSALETVGKSAVASSTKPTSSKDSNDTSPISAIAAAESNILRNTSPPRGVFANLDLDAINPRLKVQDGKDKDQDQPKSSPPKPAIEEVDFDAGAYGPKLPSVAKVWVSPPKVNVPPKSDGRRYSDSDSSSGVEWVEKPSHKHKKSKHKSKKSKKHKSKHKHKRK